jgi:polyhydroxyalkanoate synthase
MQTPLHIDPQQAFNEIAAFQRKLAAGMQNLRGLGEQEYANTPREAIYREDKLTVWHMKGNTKPTAKVPTLIVYALVNTVWMTDLQDDRSLVRNLLAQGEDVYLIDWGYPADAGRLPQRLPRS